MIRNAGKRKITAHVVLRCPECESLQKAIEEEITAAPYMIYFHKCSNCGYIIEESEWNVVKVMRRPSL
jgi:C4-type Zn-finger protein